jgi:formylglycine-generating enzyme required for sulfatase activity
MTLAALALTGFGCKHRRAQRTPRTPPPIALEMIAIPDGRFAMGSDDGDSDERPVHDVSIGAFSMQRTLVTVAEYAECEAKAACTPTPAKSYCNERLAGRERHPMNCVTWHQAAVFCAWAHARLPSEAEWEYAARGKDGRRYPWGNAPPARQLCWDGRDSDLGMMNRRSTCPVDAHPAGASPFGLLDMAGNVWEWTSDLMSSGYGSARTGPKRVVRGGTWYGYDAQDERSTLRFRERDGVEDYGTGFRCAR